MRKSVLRRDSAQTPAKSALSHRIRPTAVALAVATCFSGVVLANPTGHTVVNGTATVQQLGNILNITNSHNAIINWGSFSIGVNELTRFIQPSALSAVLNRVIGQDPSAILGALQSNGRVFLINPNGILFGAGSQINVAGLVASTLNLSNDDFLNNRMRFTDGAGAGSVVNQGSITGGNVYLVGKSVSNEGLITSPNGEVVLAAGNSVELVNPGTPNLRVEIVAPDNEARNLGTITAEAGRIGIYAGLIKQGGVLSADSAVAEGGRIMLKSTKSTALEASSVLSARGTSGGEIIVLSDMTDGVTRVAGILDASAIASANPGNGGFIETSAATVKVADNAFVTTKGSGTGRTGTWLIDPNDFTIAYGGDISGSTLGSNLESSSVVITSDQGATAGNGDIFVNESISWTANNSLTLLAKRNVTINSSINGGGDLRFHAGWNGGSTTTPVVTSGVGNITSTYDDIKTHGNVLFEAGQDILLGATTVWAGKNSGSLASDSMAKSVKFTAGRNIELTAPDGGVQIWAFGNNRSAATVLLEAKTGSINVVGSQVKADGGSATSGATGGGAVVLMSAGGGINVSNASIVSAQGGSSDTGQGGAAAVTMLAGGSVLIDGSEGSAFGASGSTGGSAAVNVVAGGDITVQGNYSDGLKAIAGGSSTVSSVVLAAAGNVNLLSNARIDTDGVAGFGGVNISLSNANVSAGTGISLSATGKLDLASGSYLGTNSGVAYINTGGNVTLSNSSRIYAPDVVMSVGGVINMNSSSTIGASLPSTIKLTFPMLVSGGYFVNGVEGVVYDEATSTGFCSPNCPAVLGTNLLVTYGGGTTPLNVPTNTLIVAMGDSTEPPDAEKDKDVFKEAEDDKKKDAPVCR